MKQGEKRKFENKARNLKKRRDFRMRQKRRRVGKKGRKWRTFENEAKNVRVEKEAI